MIRGSGLLAGSLFATACDLTDSGSRALPIEFVVTAPGPTGVSVGPNQIVILGRITLGDPCYEIAGLAVDEDGAVQAGVIAQRGAGACFAVVIDRGYRLTMRDLAPGRTELHLRHEFLRGDGRVSSYPILDTTVVVPALAAQDFRGPR